MNSATIVLYMQARNLDFLHHMAYANYKQFI